MKLRSLKIFFMLIFNISCFGFDFVSNKAKDGNLSISFMEDFIQTFHPTFFVETGTFNGGTALKMAPIFTAVHTVELSLDLYNAAKNKLKSCSNVTCYHGNSAEILKSIIPKCDGRILFWLDAHYSGGNTVFHGSNPNLANAITAIREELEAIAQSGLTDCVILVDDMRGFGSTISGTEFLGCWAYPSIQEVCALGQKINKNFDFILLGDALLMYDKTQFKPYFSPVVKACTKSRLYDGKNFSEEDLYDAERIIMNSALSAESEFIKNLYKLMSPCKDPLFHHDLWYALTCMGAHNWIEAKSALVKVPERISFLNKNKQSVHEVVRYNPARFQEYFQTIEKNIDRTYNR